MQRLNILVIRHREKVQRVQRLFKFERIFSPPKLLISDSCISLKLIRKFVFSQTSSVPSANDNLDLLAKFGSINNHHDIPSCFCKSCRQLILSSRKRVISPEPKSQSQFLVQGFFDQNCPQPTRGKMRFDNQSIANYFDHLHTEKLDLETISGSSRIRVESGNAGVQNSIGALRKIEVMEIIRFRNFLCRECLEHCQTRIHLFGGAFKNHILTVGEMQQLIHQENVLDLTRIIHSLKSSANLSRQPADHPAQPELGQVQKNARVLAGGH